MRFFGIRSSSNLFFICISAFAMASVLGAQQPAAKPDAEEVASAVTEKPGNPLDAQARVIDPDSRARVIDRDTFDALWRARVGR